MRILALDKTGLVVARIGAVDQLVTREPIGSGPAVLDIGVLDALRGLAALYVVVFHSRLWLWHFDASSAEVDLGHRLLNNLWNAALFGHLAVVLFFVISGFCIHYRQARVLSKRTVGWRAPVQLPLNFRMYAWRRVRRLYPPLVLALALTAIVDYLGAHLNPSLYAAQSPYDGLNHTMAMASDHSPITLLGNLLLQGNLAFHIFGTDSPLWSLSNEAWYYALYPLLLIVSIRFGARAVLTLSGVVSLLSLLMVLHIGAWTGGCTDSCVSVWVPSALEFWVAWAAGALIAEVYVGRIRLPGLQVLAPVALAGVLLLSANFVHPMVAVHPELTYFFSGIGLAVLLAWLMLACPASIAPWVHRVARWLAPLGQISYSLYLVHAPFLILLAAAWLNAKGTLPSGVELAVIGVLGALAIGSLCWFTVERHFVSPRTAVMPTPTSVRAHEPLALRAAVNIFLEERLDLRAVEPVE